MIGSRFALASLALTAAIVLAAPATGHAQPATAANAGTVERITVHGVSLEGNLAGDSPDRTVMVYLPPAYRTDPARRFPVVYLLHGFTDNTDQWWGVVKHFVSVPRAMDAAITSGASKDLIVVMPNAYTRYLGSVYSSGMNTGDWERYIAEDLVAYVDRHYRTIARPESRGLAGHSMGGYGTLRIGMKRPDVFSALYAMSACCLQAGQTAPNPERARKAEAVTMPDEVKALDFSTQAAFASAAAWSPNPKRPPLYLDLPTRDGQPRPDILAKWAANAPLAMLDQYVGNLRRMRGITLDVGTKDGLLAGSAAFADALTAYAIPHVYQTYEGDHVNGIHARLETKVFAFFSSTLQF